jgi:DNA-directed RNA polymerase-3 subunit RPC5
MIHCRMILSFVVSFQQICQGLRQLAISLSTLPKRDAKMVVAAAYGVDSPEELQEIINQVAININDLYVLKSSPEHPEYDPLRLFTISFFFFFFFFWMSHGISSSAKP